MKTTKIRLLSIFLTLCILFSLLPASAVAETETDPGASPDPQTASDQQEAEIVYSDASVCFDRSGESIPETAGATEITLRRGGNVGAALEVTLLVYDNSANYGEDYQLRYNGEVISKLPGATSIYDAFRDGGALNEGWTMALTEDELAQAASDAVEEVSAADMLAQLNELNVLAARVPFTFPAVESIVTLTVEVLDDSISEYDETFLMVLQDENGEVMEDAQLLISIEDNEPDPSVTVGFDCDYTLIADSRTGLANLVLNRKGDLATSTAAILLMDGEALGYVDFAPYQDTQIVYAEPGVYTLMANDGCSVTAEQVTVASTDGSVTVPEGGDPELDAVPNAYASMRNLTTKEEWTAPTWFPTWATYTATTETSDYIAYMSGSGSVYRQCKIEGVGKFTTRVDSGNMHNVDTSGTFSRMKKGLVRVRTNGRYDMTGIESVEITGKVEGLEKSNQIALFLHTQNYYDPSAVGSKVADKTISNSGNNTVTLVCPLPNGYQGSSYVYVENIDPTKSDDGCNLYIPNGFKANKRTYRFRIATPDQLSYLGIGKVGITIQKGSNDIFLKMNNGNVTIAYEVDYDLPVKLVGYKLRNASTGATSGVISISGSSFTFDKAFLKSYESTYCAQTTTNGTTYSTFEVIPVFEKIPIEVELEDSLLGTISFKNCTAGTQLYVGDRITISGTANSGATFSGVYFKCYKNLSNSNFTSGTIDKAASGIVTMDLGSYSKIILQGAFSADADKLIVNFAESNEENRHGKLGFTPGVVLEGDAYVKGDFFPLVASPDAGYVTRWNSDGRLYYGNTFYYQLDGNPNHNSITVEFVPESNLTMKTGTVSGKLYVYDVELSGGGESKVILPNKKYTTFSDQEHTGTSDSSGSYTISDFKAVIGGTYSMMVTYRNDVGYVNFVPYPTESTTASVDVAMPQFPAGSVYPSAVKINLGHVTTTQNVIQLRSSDTGSITVEVTNEAADTITKVTLHFLSTRASDYGRTMTTIDLELDKTMTSQNDSRLYTYWTAEITDIGDLPPQSRMYVSLEAERFYPSTEVKVDDDGNVISTSQTVTIGKLETGLVNSGYEFISAITDDSLVVEQTIPDMPGAQNAYSVDTAALEIPLLGSADFSMTSASGGYFVQKTVNGTTYLICGYSITPVYGVGTLQDKYSKAKQTQTALSEMRDVNMRQQGDEADVVNVLIGKGNSGGAGTAKQQASKKFASLFSVYPAFMFKFALTPGVDDEGNDKTYVTGFEMALGLDSNYLRNIPFSVYGVPFYLCFSAQVEALAQAQYSIAPGKAEQGSDMTMTLYEMCQTPEAADNAEISGQAMLAFPKLSLGMKTGLGYNAFAGVYLNGTVEMPMTFQISPYVDAGGKFGFSISAGADLVFFTANYKFVNITQSFGDDDLVDELVTIQGYSATAGKQMEAAGENVYVLGEDEEAPSMEEMLNSLTFSVMDRSENAGVMRRSVAQDSSVLAEDVFKNTAVQLVQLENGSIMALFLTDNGADGYNYLTASYAISTDEGKTWSDIQYVNSNIGAANTGLQFDINVFELEDRMLITWSEADFDTMLDGLDADNLTLAQIAKLMNAMNLRGRFFDSASGQPMGEAFTIAENSTVACGALDAVQNGDNVYVYYQRNAFPTTDGTTLDNILSTERTIALARANVSAPAQWTSTSVRATNENGQQYRITEVEPFVHDGVMGEILVLDRNGKLAIYDEETGEWTADNEDRQLYLRTYDFDEDGKPQPTALIPLTDAADCAQSPQVVSSEDYLHLFWNENGEVVYLTDFVATWKDHADVQSGALLLKNSDGTITEVEQETVRGSQIAASDTMHVGTTFSASMAADGNVLLSWIANDETDEGLLPTDEIYGVILNTVTNAEAVIRSGMDTGDEAGNENVYQLWPVGQPVALTDEDTLIGALDSICMESGSGSKFLLAYTRLNATMRSDVTSADLMAVQSVDAPSVSIETISAESYPLPGSEMTVLVEVSNNGLEPLTGTAVTATGIGAPVTVTSAHTINPGETEEIELKVAVPQDFDRTTELVITASGVGEQARYTDSSSQAVKYGAYFTVDEMSELISIPYSTDCEAHTTIQNIGNAAGCPTVTFTNTIYGSDEYRKEYVFAGEEMVAPGETVTLTHVLEDTLMNESKTANLVVSLGEGYDQTADSLMPVPVIDVWQDDAAEAPIETVFTDVADHWAKDSVEYAYNRGLMNGMSQTTFRPDNETTRAMLVTVLYRMAGEPEVTTSSPFADVSNDLWYSDAIIWAAENGIVNGCGHGVFKPDDPATREQTAAIFYRFAGWLELDTGKTASLSGFADSGLISSYAAEPMSWAYATGLIRGVTRHKLCPMDTTTRAQLAVILKRFCEEFGV